MHAVVSLQALRTFGSSVFEVLPVKKRSVGPSAAAERPPLECLARSGSGDRETLRSFCNGAAGGSHRGQNLERFASGLVGSWDTEKNSPPVGCNAARDRDV